MNKSAQLVLWFDQIGKEDIPFAGGKGANLGEMYSNGIPVPNGFVVASKSYYEFLEKTSLKNKILSELSGLDTNDSKGLIHASKSIKTAIMAAQMPLKIQKEIKDGYHKLCGEFDKNVAVRSSATAEDLPDASFAGQQESYLNVKGFHEVIESVQKCWASLFESRAIFYRTDKGYNHLKVGIAVPVQLMVQSEVSGIMFTVNPLSNNRKEVSIEAAFGLGQPIVSGEITPDQYIIDKKSLDITYKYIAKQTWQLTLAGKTEVSKKFQEAQKLANPLIKELAEIGIKVENHYGKPQDIEWGLENKVLHIVQSRPVTTLNSTETVKVQAQEANDLKGAKVLFEGLGASPGVASGKVVIIRKPSEISKVKDGDILVAEMTNPDYVPAMRRASAILTDKGGRTSHAAIVSRELGIPAVVGSQNATKMLKDGEEITIDGSSGKVYEGVILLKVKEEVTSIIDSDTIKVKTATKIYVNLAEPDLANDIAKRNVDGVGLLRAEFMIASIGTHPREFIAEKRKEEFINKLAVGLEQFVEAFHPSPVIYRATDFRSNEYKNLKGGAKYETDEFNPMIGFRGASRYIDDPEVFNMELEAIKLVRNKKGYKNLHVMIPFVRTVSQLRDVKKLMSLQGLKRGGSFKIWMMVEIPSNVILLEEFIKEGIDGVSIGTNDLTMLVLGVDRDNEKVANVYSELDPAVMWCLEKIVTVSKKHGVTCSVCGQAPSMYPDLVEKLVGWGVTSVSVSPDVIEKTRDIVYEVEKKILKKKK
ncbi:phosphoenolpyruvate synthase [candidate division WWE3 bacterium RIFCSPLOWO2_12_FULL_36_10]|uniref:Phosphoenolpyruvate synthase n=1 Tax=candidate division WWE3 bacterium RIFCSPLOWO2_12_FULL_36_10 TaxID=1802630 RepID=A0A1F4VHG1_UNCKA|nr:MAG: phosphoenolpyruvate synthase [candidate division WWE3 bacterium RIFCSPLOWO2_12_FULL_36_10]